MKKQDADKFKKWQYKNRPNVVGFSPADNEIVYAMPISEARAKRGQVHKAEKDGVDLRRLVLATRNPEARIVFAGLRLWFINQAVEASNPNTVYCVYRHTKYFLEWANTQKEKTTYDEGILKAYEAHRVNKKGLKPQSSGLAQIVPSIRAYAEQIPGLEALLKKTTRSVEEAPEQYTLTDWLFSRLSDGFKEKNDAITKSLESPKILMNSFSISVATLLINLIRVRESFESLRGVDGCHPVLKDNNWYWRTKGGESDIITIKSRVYQPVHVSDFVDNNAPKEAAYLRAFVQYDFGIKKTNAGARYGFAKQNIFVEHDTPSEIESLLFGWLMAWLAVQPSDIVKLKSENIKEIKNSSKKTTKIYVSYAKGRAKGRVYDTMALSSVHQEFKAIEHYKNRYSNAFFYRVRNHKPITKDEPIYKRSVSDDLLFCFSIFNQEVVDRHETEKVPMVFPLAANEATRNAHTVSKVSGITYTHIKNSSVHARSDMYRAGDLINVNSHTSITEGTRYLTDYNRDYVNRHERIRRILEKDLKNNIYTKKPVQEARIAIALASKISMWSDGQFDADTIESSINDFGVYTGKHGAEKSAENVGRLIVIDCPATFVKMRYFLDQVKESEDSLQNVRPEYYEKTILPNYLFCSHMIAKLSAKSRKEGRELYSKIKPHLPGLFEAVLTTIWSDGNGD